MYVTLLCVAGFISFATTAPQYRIIEGKVVSNGDEPVSLATVILLSADSSFIVGEHTDDSGHFSIEVQALSGFLSVSSLEYQDTVIAFDDQTRMPITIRLLPANHTLSEVSVTGRRMLVEQKADRMVYNVGTDNASAGSNALQVLSRLPGIFVDPQGGTISLTGKDGVLVMINNRLTRISPQVLISQLEGMKAENIEKIEVIHQPPARYDASGNAGIIHIVLKKDDRYGLNGALGLTLGYGQRGKLGSNVSLNWRKNKVNLYGTYSNFLDLSDEYVYVINRSYEYEGSRFENYSHNLMKDHSKRSHDLRLGMDWEINQNTTLGILGGWGDFRHHANIISESTSFVDGIQTDDIVYDQLPFVLNKSFYINGNLFHKLNEGEEINFDVDFVQYDLASPGTFRRVRSVQPLPQEIVVDRMTPIGLWTRR